MTKVISLENIKKRLVFSPAEKTKTSEIVNFLVQRGVKIEGINKKQASLEEMYSSILKAREDDYNEKE